MELSEMVEKSILQAIEAIEDSETTFNVATGYDHATAAYILETLRDSETVEFSETVPYYPHVHISERA